MAHVRIQMSWLRSIFLKIATRENGWAMILFLILLLLVILTADQSPTWIYQGF
jgi:hypothetical protein